MGKHRRHGDAQRESCQGVVWRGAFDAPPRRRAERGQHGGQM